MSMGRGGGANSVGGKVLSVPFTTSTHGHFVFSPNLLTLRDQDGIPSNSTIDVYNCLR